MNHILLVDDEASHAELVCRAFDGHEDEYLIEVARNLSEAIDSISFKNPDLVLTDYRLPDGSGDELVQIARGRFPVILMTAFGDEQLAVQSIKAGALDYVVKTSDVFSSMPVIVARSMREWSMMLEKKRAEDALHEITEVFRLFMEYNPIYVFIKDKNIRAVYLSGNFEKMIGMPVDEIIGKSMHELFPPDLAQKIIEDDQRILRERKPFETVEELDGKIYSTIKFPIIINDEVKYLAGCTIDITDRIKAEEEKDRLQEQLLQSQKMESIGRLAGGVAHDFNNMLQAILGFSELAIMNLDPSDQTAGYILEIQRAAQRSADLTRQLLAFARRQAVVPKILDINDTVAGMLKMLGRLIGEQINLVWMPGHRLWKVKIDPGQIDQILANLSVNARDAIKGTGHVIIRTENTVVCDDVCVRFPDIVPGDYVLVAVTDDGCGMDSDTASRVFEPFFTTKNLGQGTGLGLATVYGIVSQNNGFVDVISEKGKGTTFSIYLPRMIDTDEASGKSEQPVSTDHGTGTIVLVEDEKVLLDIGKIMLEGQGYYVMTASTPGEAIRIAETFKGRIHLLVTDVVMPEMNGRELAEKFVKLKPESGCLFMSGYPDDLVAPHGIITGGLNFIQKPFSINELAAKVRDILESS